VVKVNPELEAKFRIIERMAKGELDLVVYDPEDMETYPSICQDPDSVKERFGFTGGEQLVFDAAGNYLGVVTSG
jgi:hypothetical protein